MFKDFLCLRLVIDLFINLFTFKLFKKNIEFLLLNNSNSPRPVLVAKEDLSDPHQAEEADRRLRFAFTLRPSPSGKVTTVGSAYANAAVCPFLIVLSTAHHVITDEGFKPCCEAKLSNIETDAPWRFKAAMIINR